MTRRSRNVAARLTLVLAFSGAAAGPASDAGGETLAQLGRDLAAAEQARLGGDLDRAEQLYRSALTTVDTRFGGSNLPAARAVDGLAGVLREREQLNEAEALYRRAVELWGRLLGPGQPRTAVALHNLAGVLEESGQRAGALQVLERALRVWRDAGTPEEDGPRWTRTQYERLLRDQSTDTSTR